MLNAFVVSSNMVGFQAPAVRKAVPKEGESLLRDGSLRKVAEVREGVGMG